MTPFIKQYVLLALVLALPASIASAQTITSISPTSIPAGSGTMAITVNGSNFSSDAVVEINGNPRYTVDSSTKTLLAYVYAADDAKAGTLTVDVLNDSGVTPHLSNKVTMKVTGSGTTPPPVTPPPVNPPPPPPPQPGHVSITITSPVQNQQVCNTTITLLASAATSNAGAEITRWQVSNSAGASLYSTSGPTSSIDPKLSLPVGTQTLQIEAWDSTGAHADSNVAFDATTATPPCGGNTTGPVVKWVGCMHTVTGQTHQAIDFTIGQGGTPLAFNATLYFGANCSPNNWADQFGFGQMISFGGFSYIFWFRDFPDQPNTSAIWTVGNQSSGCINYTAVPAC